MGVEKCFGGLAGGTDGKYLKDDFTWDTPAGGVTSANVQAQTYTYYSDTGAADAYVITPSPAIGSYAAGQRFQFLAGAANTGASTLNVSALGVKAIKKMHDQALAANDIEAGSIVDVIYDGTNFQMVSMVATNAGSNWTDGGTYVKPATDGDTVRAYDSGGTEYAEMQHDVLRLRERTTDTTPVSNIADFYTKRTTVAASYGSDFFTGGTASANTYAGIWTPAKAFDDATGSDDMWYAQGGPNWYLKYDLGVGVAKTARKYRLLVSAGNTATAPKAWTFQGSNNDSDWTTIDTQADQTGWTGGAWREYTFSNSTAYRYYKWVITESNYSTDTCITEAEGMEYTPETNTYDLTWMSPSGNSHVIHTETV